MVHGKSLGQRRHWDIVERGAVVIFSLDLSASPGQVDLGLRAYLLGVRLDLELLDSNERHFRHGNFLGWFNFPFPQLRHRPWRRSLILGRLWRGVIDLLLCDDSIVIQKLIGEVGGATARPIQTLLRTAELF